ncbi:MAG TPA: GNAT family N-acetyltransferase [Thermoanaerobaculia bacterium]|nr:GNAT family N-acetyltransferase [Thermoanaerobaculia bacterium]
MSVEMTSITFRPETAEDREFIYRLYATTRATEMQLVPWTDEQKDQFCRQQADAQRAHYDKVYERAEYLVVLRDGEPIGRLYLHSVDGDFLVLDIALLPEHRGSGIGGMIMRGVMDQAAARNDIVTIHVEQYNPAMHLYKRLGFVPIDQYGVYFLMEWRPEGRR